MQIKRSFVTLAIIFLTASSAFSAGDKALNYQDLLAVLGQPHINNEQVNARLVGKTLTVKLRKSPAGNALYVNKADGVLFSCKQRPANFKGASVTSQIVEYGDTLDGDVYILLESCGQ